MEIFYHISPSTLAEDFIIKIYEAQSPTAEVGTQTVPAPHDAPFSVSFTGLDKVPHILRMFGATSGMLLHSFDDLPTENVVTVFDDIKFKIGDGQTITPAAGAPSATIPALIGLSKDDFNIFRNGTFFYPTLYDFEPTTGEITLIFPDVFGYEGNQEEVLITRKPAAVLTQVNDSVVGKQFGGNDAIPQMFIDVNTTVNYDPSHLRHLIRLAGANANYVFPENASIPIGYIFRVTNFGIYADPTDKGKVTFSNASLIWAGTPKTSLDIQFSGTYEFEFDGTYWNCTMYNAIPTSNLPQILYAATVDLGTMTATDQTYNITIPYISSAPDYRAICTLVSNSGNMDNDNDLMFVTGNKVNTSFQIRIRRISGGVQKLKLDFIIVK